MAKNSVYLDYNATTPPLSDLAESIPQLLSNWGNASSIHAVGRGPKAIIREVRTNLAKYLGVHPLEIIFTSGGSEANNLALKGLILANKGPRRKIVISSVEHPSVLKQIEFIKNKFGYQVEIIPVNKNGILDLEIAEKIIDEHTLVVSVMLANNETGIVFPIKQITEIAHRRGALMHTDAVQALGKIDFNFLDFDVDLASFSGHKFYALKGAGALYVKRGVLIDALIDGGGQERGRRGGTENIISIASLGISLNKANLINEKIKHMQRLRDFMELRIQTDISGITINCASTQRLANTSSMLIQGIDGETLLMNLDLLGFAVSTGAACSSGNSEPSAVLLAMGFLRQEAQSSLRVSLGWDTTLQEIENFCDALVATVNRLRSLQSEFQSGVQL